MEFGGFQKTTMIDYPGRLASIVFVAGCNMRCGYCYNSDLVFRKATPIPEDGILSILTERKRLIDSVVVTGGEPTIWEDLPGFIIKLKNLGMNVKLDTNGSNPAMLMRLVSKGLLDYVAIDIKAPWNKYASITGTNINTERIKESVDFVRTCGVDYEFRTTLAPGLTKYDIYEIANQISPAKRWFLQKFIPTDKVLNPDILEEKWLDAYEINLIASGLSKKHQECIVRG